MSAAQRPLSMAPWEPVWNGFGPERGEHAIPGQPSGRLDGRGGTAAAVKDPLIWPVVTPENVRLVGKTVGAGDKDEFKLISSNDTGGCVPTDKSFDQVNTILLVVPANDAGRQMFTV